MLKDRRTSRFTIAALLIGVVFACTNIACETASIRRSREAVLRDDLFQLRSLINQFALDKNKQPQSLQELVTAGYLKRIPEDPFTHSRDTWVVKYCDNNLSLGICDVLSGSHEKDERGLAYSEW